MFRGTGMGPFVRLFVGHVLSGVSKRLYLQRFASELAEAIFCNLSFKSGIFCVWGGRVQKIRSKLVFFLHVSVLVVSMPWTHYLNLGGGLKLSVFGGCQNRTGLRHLFFGGPRAVSVPLVKCLRILCFVVYSSFLPQWVGVILGAKRLFLTLGPKPKNWTEMGIQTFYVVHVFFCVLVVLLIFSDMWKIYKQVEALDVLFSMMSYFGRFRTLWSLRAPPHLTLHYYFFFPSFASLCWNV